VSGQHIERKLPIISAVIPAERSESRDPVITAAEYWIPDAACGGSGMTPFKWFSERAHLD
jgi:hypothetical protein